MKQSSTLFLQGVIALFGIAALAIMIRIPLTEGRAANLDLFSIYSDPFILFGFAASIPFFIALYKAFKLFGYIRQNKAFTINSVRTLRSIKYCAIILGLAIVMAGVYIKIFHNKDDDPAGFLAMCIATTFVSLAAGRATPESSVCRLHISTGSRRSAAIPAIPLPIGISESLGIKKGGMP